MNPTIRPSVLLVTLLLSTGAMAQWQWLDKDGRKVFSDRAPPPGVPDKSILKRPGAPRVLAPLMKENDSGGTPLDTNASGIAGEPSVNSAPRISGIDNELADKKKKAEQEDAVKRKFEEDRVAKVRADNCVRAKQSKAGFDSGVRLWRFNQQGEREIMDDATRATEAQRIQAVIDAECK